MAIRRACVLGIGVIAAAIAAPAASADRAAIQVGPGPVHASLPQGAQRVSLRISPNRATTANAITLQLTRAGKPVRHARVTMAFAMQEMAMATQSFQLFESRPGTYSFTGRALVMGGTWNLAFIVKPVGGTRFTVSVVDRLSP
ncbi:MAG TPA: FixH family protein [Gaiellales bacterium]|jgi:hypothetical protein